MCSNSEILGGKKYYICVRGLVKNYLYNNDMLFIVFAFLLYGRVKKYTTAMYMAATS